MPFELSLGPAFNREAIITYFGGGTTAKATTVEQAVQDASIAIKQLTTAPDPGNLPDNATPGQLYSFTSQPGTLYFQGADNVWRALLAVPVG